MTTQNDTNAIPAGMVEVTKAHPWEVAGLGKSPFKYIGEVAQALTTDGRRVVSNTGGVEISTKPGGTCEYCGAYILNMFRVRSADGREFVVGSDCIGKLNGSADKKLVAAVKAAVAAKNKARTKDRNAAKLATLATLLADEATRAKLATLPHPSPRPNGRTLLDYAEWMARNAGTAGKMKTLKAIEAVMAGK
jgi:hypothetical protein